MGGGIEGRAGAVAGGANAGGFELLLGGGVEGGETHLESLSWSPEVLHVALSVGDVKRGGSSILTLGLSGSGLRSAVPDEFIAERCGGVVVF